MTDHPAQETLTPHERDVLRAFLDGGQGLHASEEALIRAAEVALAHATPPAAPLDVKRLGRAIHERHDAMAAKCYCQCPWDCTTAKSILAHLQPGDREGTE